MSTSILASAIEDAGKKYNLEIESKAYSQMDIDDIIKNQHPDCLLLGPQVSYIAPSIIKKYGEKVAIAQIPSDVYGAFDGEGALKVAIVAMKKFKKGENN